MNKKKIPKFIPKIELVFVFLIVSVFILSKVSPSFMNLLNITEVKLANYFSSDRISMISNSAFILIGVYATITAVFGSGKSMATSKLSKKDLNGDFITCISFSMISSLILGFYIIFLDDKYIYLLFCLIIWTISSLIRFLIIILLMYSYNVKTFKKIDRQEKENYENMMDVLTEISIELKRIKNIIKDEEK
ncbi:hypothetical protein [Tepidibacter sp. Z1-5]|uniref:hypothetical protein n=1 Tax=Tepidibacter sp. Z1-5 TaxID=3134138 RepID=UPI0030BEDD89